MKKTYITPSMETIKIASQTQMLAGSTLGVGDTPTNPDNSDSRGWEGDWEED